MGCKGFLVQAYTHPNVAQGQLSMVSQKECTEHTFQERSLTHQSLQCAFLGVSLRPQSLL